MRQFSAKNDLSHGGVQRTHHPSNVVRRAYASSVRANICEFTLNLNYSSPHGIRTLPSLKVSC
jgi:hypothetical protein